MAIPADKLTVESNTPKPLIELRDLKTYFKTDKGAVKAVDGVTLMIPEEKTLGIVGESGCGKSVTAQTIMGLIPKKIAQISGEVLYYQEANAPINLVELDPRGPSYRRIRGKDIAMIFQEPMTSLNPVYTIGNQITEAIMLHQKVDKHKAQKRAIEMLDFVGIPAPAKRLSSYPHQLSGGMRQRVMIAMALSCNPKVLIADEPTTALDVTIQAQILELMNKLQKELKMSIVMITHDLGVVAGMADYVAVMYLGQIVEQGTVRQVFKEMKHPYTRGLLGSVPILGGKNKGKLTPIEGMVPDPRNIPRGCRFANRCPHRMEKCVQMPEITKDESGHEVRCWLYSEVPFDDN